MDEDAGEREDEDTPAGDVYPKADPGEGGRTIEYPGEVALQF